MELTADTITDAQIRELMREAASPESGLIDRAVIRLCKVALNDAPTYLRTNVVRDARARCAAIVNATNTGTGRPT